MRHRLCRPKSYQNRSLFHKNKDSTEDFEEIELKLGQSKGYRIFGYRREFSTLD